MVGIEQSVVDGTTCGIAGLGSARIYDYDSAVDITAYLSAMPLAHHGIIGLIQISAVKSHDHNLTRLLKV